jgi:glycosyltransferase involved in cell wall biosynthesis
MTLATMIKKSVREWNKARLIRKHRLKKSESPFTLAVLGIMKNESMTIDEWVIHYQQVGADKIYLIDNGSTDDTVAKAQKWVDKGVVELIERPRPHRQLYHYWDAVQTFKIRKTCEWLLIADLDEFWFCPDGATLPAKLKTLEYCSVIYANWKIFGSSGLQKQPVSVRRGFTQCDPKLYPGNETKYIVRTSAIKSRTQIQVHKFRGADSSVTLSDNENFSIFHYRIQSREYYERVKQVRGDVLYDDEEIKEYTDRNDAYFKDFDARCTAIDRTLADLVEQDRLGKS